MDASRPTTRCSSRTCSSHVDYLDETIAALSAEIEERAAPFRARSVSCCCTIPGVAERTAEVILAEFGPDMGRFPSHRHAASWAAICPGNDESRRQAPLGQDAQGGPLACGPR